MNVSLYQAAAALDTTSRWQEVISQNLASSSIPGFKKQEMSFSAVQAGLKPVAAGGAQHYALPQAVSATNFQPGQLKATGANTDVALEGPGFLVVQLPDGTTAYTRDGELKLNVSGQLTTKQGFPVLGEGGPIQLDLNNPAPVSIARTGEVTQGTENKGKLRAVEFDRPSLLTPTQYGQFLANNPTLHPADSTSTSFQQGFLEGSNTSPTMEMAHLISSMRLYEANQRVIQAQDQRMARAITELGNAS